MSIANENIFVNKIQDYKGDKNLKRNKKKRNSICLICWIFIPTAIITLLVLDALKLYAFNTERLIIIGACIFVVLIPFFKEITVKDFSLKRETTNNQKQK